MSDSEATPISVDSERSMKSRESCLCGREVCIKVTAMLGYFVLLLWRFVGLILFSIHVTDCLFRERHASYRCKNFTLFSHANELEIAWQMASFINAVIVIVALLKVPGYQGYLSTLRNNWKHARFWSLFFQFLAAVSFKIVVISTEPPGCIWIYIHGGIHSFRRVPVEWCSHALEALRSSYSPRGSWCLRCVASHFLFGKFLPVYHNFSSSCFPSDWAFQLFSGLFCASGYCSSAKCSRGYL